MARAKGTVPSAELVDRLEKSLASEREEVFYPLLRRMRNMSELLSAGKDVPSSVIDEGLELWEQCLSRLHDPHIRQIQTAGLREEESRTGATAFSELVADVDRARTRIGTMRGALTAYEAEPKIYRTLLSLVIYAEAQAGSTWERFEEEYAATHIPALFTPEEVAAWNDTLSQTAIALPELREKVQDFRKRTAEYSGEPLPASP